MPSFELFGTDVQFVLNDDGSFLMRRWDQSTLSFLPVPSPSASLSAGWADGYRFSIALAELSSPKRIEFAAGTRAAAGGALAKDQLNGWYDTRTGSGGVFDPVTGSLRRRNRPPFRRLPPLRSVSVRRARDATESESRGRQAHAHRSTRFGDREPSAVEAFESARPPARPSSTSVAPAASPTTTPPELETPAVGVPLAEGARRPALTVPWRRRDNGFDTAPKRYHPA